jgi:DNA modification methylase
MEVNKIYHDDWMNNQLPDKSVQLIIADPPYETNELIISRHNLHCLQCRSIAHNVRVLGEEAD